MSSTPHNDKTDQSGSDMIDLSEIKHTQLGIWDLYEDERASRSLIERSSHRTSFKSIKNDFPYFLQMCRDLGSIPGCKPLLSAYVVLGIMRALIPAINLKISSRLLSIVQSAVENRQLNRRHLFQVTAGRLICKIAASLIALFTERIENAISTKISRFYAVGTFYATVRLDLSTFKDSAVQSQLWQSCFQHGGPGGSSLVWNAFMCLFQVVNTSINVVSQLAVLRDILKDQRDGTLLCALTSLNLLVRWWRGDTSYMFTELPRGVWGATTKSREFLRLTGLREMAEDLNYRQEIVAGGLWKFMLCQYEKYLTYLGDRANVFYSELAQRDKFENWMYTFFYHPLEELPTIVFTLRAIQYPATIPVSLTSLNLITETTQSFMRSMMGLFNTAGTVSDQLEKIRHVYEVGNIPNQIPDGDVAFPEDGSPPIEEGVCIEFKNVSFKYPSAKQYALRNVSFKIERGQLCVVVGSNGSGKSTILKLITRLYDPTEGQILIDGKDIRTVRLDDLRRAISVLFQDYTLFPLSIADNIALGNPDRIEDMDAIREAARHGGAEELVLRMPHGFDTTLERPRAARESYPPLFGTSETVDLGRIRKAGDFDRSELSVSGGQMQRIALARTFMRVLPWKEGHSPVGLLMFDEPSASLDPIAEHDLFERLRKLRGSKTMIFSSHRFGHLTRHADIILYINDSTVLEEGTHEKLMETKGEYYRLWNLQAKSFI